MKGKRPTRNQRLILKQNKLDTYKWLVQKDTPVLMQVVHIDTKEEKILIK